MSCENCERLAQQIVQQQKQIAKQQKQIDLHSEQQVQIDLLLARVAELEKKLARYENPNTPPSAGGGYPKREPSGKSPGAQPGHVGTTREQKKPDEVRDAPSITECPNCHHALGDPLYSIPSIFEDAPAPQPVRVIQVNQGVYECLGCGEIHIAQDPQIPKSGRFGFNLMIEAVMMRFEQRLPLRKIQQAFRNQFKLELTPATIWALIRRVAAAGEEEFRRILKGMHKQGVVNADETSRKVDGKMRWLWVFLSAASVLFLAGRGRGREVIEEVLGKDFGGLLGCDGWKPYTFIKLLQRCWAHLLRESKNLEEKVGGVACQIHASLKKLFEKAEQMQVAALSGVERQHVHDSLNRRLLTVIQLAKEHKATMKFGEKIENGLGNWFTAVLHPEIELTNNSAERALREPVIQRKISGSLRSAEGVHALEVLLTLLGTWNLQGKNPRQMLLKTLQGS